MLEPTQAYQLRWKGVPFKTRDYMMTRSKARRSTGPGIESYFCPSEAQSQAFASSQGSTPVPPSSGSEGGIMRPENCAANMDRTTDSRDPQATCDPVRVDLPEPALSGAHYPPERRICSVPSVNIDLLPYYPQSLWSLSTPRHLSVQLPPVDSKTANEQSPVTPALVRPVLEAAKEPNMEGESECIPASLDYSQAIAPGQQATPASRDGTQPASDVNVGGNVAPATSRDLPSPRAKDSSSITGDEQQCIEVSSQVRVVDEPMGLGNGVGVDSSADVIESIGCKAQDVSNTEAAVVSIDSEADVQLLATQPRSRDKTESVPSGANSGKRIHSFFTRAGRAKQKAPPGDRVNTSQRVSTFSAHERLFERAPKRRRAQVVHRDPWELGELATIHANAPCLREEDRSIACSRLTTLASDDRINSLDDPFWIPRKCPQVGNKGSSLPPSLSPPGNFSARQNGSTLWAERFRSNCPPGPQGRGRERLDELVSWLSQFYKKRRGAPSDGDTLAPGESVIGGAGQSSTRNSEDSAGASYEYCSSEESYSDDEFAGDIENIVLIDGPVGSGKSTLVSQAAKQLGLSILEVNCATIRTGKRVKEIVVEALVSHRVRGSTLVVLEEVDWLFEEEKGFWAAVLELSEKSGRRRPIVLTADHISPAMQAAFGSLEPASEVVVSRLMGSPLPEFDLQRPLKRIHIEPVSVKEMYTAIGSVCDTMGPIELSKVERRTLTGLHANGDIRKALNTLQFWSLPGEGSVVSLLEWPEDREEVRDLASTAAASRLLVL